MLKRAIFVAKFAGEEENIAMTWTKALEKFDGGESEDTANKCVIDRTRFQKC
jgi:hypothetical protein